MGQGDFLSYERGYFLHSSNTVFFHQWKNHRKDYRDTHFTYNTLPGKLSVSLTLKYYRLNITDVNFCCKAMDPFQINVIW